MSALLTRLAEPVQALPPAPAERRRMVVGLLNNMPDAALAATERQFSDLLKTAADGVDIELRLFALDGIERGARALELMHGRYESAEALPHAGLDALIVTGNEPRAAELDAEPYWPALAEVIDWAHEAGIGSLWSCLAAHAAVLRLDDVRRRPLPAKLSGVFHVAATGDDPLLAEAPLRMMTPHSRQNGLDERELARSGYRVLTRSSAAGVDAFARRGAGLALYLQGHPEYDADTLMREYLRDVGRFLRRERPHHPATPADYFDAATERRLERLAAHALRRPAPDMLAHYVEALAHAAPIRTWRASAIQLYRNWLAEAAQQPRLSAPGAAHRSRTH
jgi:homoserine O-succinyltransferase